LYPLHVVALSFTLFLNSIINMPYQEPDLVHVFLHFFLLHGSGLEKYGTLNAPSWAVSTEFIAALVLGYFITHRATTKTRIILLILLLVLFELNILDLRIVLCCMALILGTLIHELINFKKIICQNRIIKSLHAIVLFGFGCTLGIRMILNRISYKSATLDFLRESYLVDLVLIWLFLYIIIRGVKITNVALVKLGNWGGGVSYAIYLLHIPVLALSHEIFLKHIGSDSVIIFLIFSGFALLLLSQLAHFVIEIPILSWCRSHILKNKQ
jgi:peptidoglycan/LPS O-acetylase OafA/YrhL